MGILMKLAEPCKKCGKKIVLAGGYNQVTHEAGHLETCEDYLR